MEYPTHGSYLRCGEETPVNQWVYANECVVLNGIQRQCVGGYLTSIAIFELVESSSFHNSYTEGAILC